MIDFAIIVGYISNEPLTKLNHLGNEILPL